MKKEEVEEIDFFFYLFLFHTKLQLTKKFIKMLDKFRATLYN